MGFPDVLSALGGIVEGRLAKAKSVDNHVSHVETMFRGTRAGEHHFAKLW
jgi:hypothetical protein